MYKLHTLFVIFVQIKFESFSDPLRSLGCFCSDVKTVMPYMHQRPKHSLTNFQRSESLAWFNAEFKLFDPPSSKLSKSSSLHAAAEIFRFLRDMALGIPDTDSEPLILDNCIDEILSPSYLGRYLVHPGATICMVDLLPAVHWTCYRVVKSCNISDDSDMEMTDTEVEIRNVYLYKYKRECGVAVVVAGLPIGYSVIVALTGLPIGYSVIVALTGPPIGYSVIVALTGLLIGYSIIVALTGLLIGYSIIVALTGLPIGYSIIVALTGLPIGYSVIVALTCLPIGYSVIVALTGLPIGYSVIVALTGLPIGYSVIVALTGLPIE